jgi:predicted enzyme related to lactoylglutathione lyase
MQPAMPNPIVHFEIGCSDHARTQTFFSKLFDWQMEEAGPATMIRTGGDVGGHITTLGHEPHHYTMFYVQVDNVQSYLDKAGSLGGKTLVPPIEIPTGTFAWCADPEGNTIGLFKPKAQA